MKDVTSTSFGLVIAFLLPGLMMLYACSQWSEALRHVFETFLTVQSNVGLSILVLLVAVAVGLLVTVVRYMLFEVGICHKHRLAPADFARLNKENILAGFRAAVDEHYRYHQFWGGMVLVMPVLWIGVLKDVWGDGTSYKMVASWVLFLGFEGLIVYAACIAYQRYVERAKAILSGEK